MMSSRGGEETAIDCGGSICPECVDCDWCPSEVEPIRIRGRPNDGYIDVIFVPLSSYRGNLPAFDAWVIEFIRDWYFKLDQLTFQDTQVPPRITPIPDDFKDRFNLYYNNFGWGETDSCAGELPSEEESNIWAATCTVECSPLTLFIGCTCLDYEPTHFWGYAPFADVGAIISDPAVRDIRGCAYPLGPPSWPVGTQFIADEPSVAMHESGHAIFGLIDEYDGDTYYDLDLQYHDPHEPSTVWKDFRSYGGDPGDGWGWCDDFARNHGFPVGDGSTTGCRHFTNPDLIPYVRFDQDPDLMNVDDATGAAFGEADT